MTKKQPLTLEEYEELIKINTENLESMQQTRNYARRSKSGAQIILEINNSIQNIEKKIDSINKEIEKAKAILIAEEIKKLADIPKMRRVRIFNDKQK